jgi:hypothetical protein
MPVEIILSYERMNVDDDTASLRGSPLAEDVLILISGLGRLLESFVG